MTVLDHIVERSEWGWVDSLDGCRISARIHNEGHVTLVDIMPRLIPKGGSVDFAVTQSVSYPQYMYAIEYALAHGYSVIPKTGTIIGLKGHPLIIRRHGNQRYPTVSLVTSNMSRHVYCVPAHKVVAYALWERKAFQRGLVVRHLNDDTEDNRSVNLALGTYSDNAHDKSAEQRQFAARQARAAQGYQPANTILTVDQVLEIRSIPIGTTGRARRGKIKPLATKFGVSPSTVSAALHGHTHTTIENVLLEG